MPEISARDLRRLEAVEDKLVRARDERKTLAAERRELRAAVAANASRARTLEREAAASDAKLEAILAENASLAARLDEMTADLDRLQAASLELRSQLDGTTADVERTKETLAKTQSELAGAVEERKGLAGSLKLANEQLAGKGITPVVPAAEVAKLIDELVVRIGTGLPGMVIRDGELRLQVAFGKVGQQTGFVIPSAESPPEVRENLHEVTLRLDRTVDIPGR